MSSDPSSARDVRVEIGLFVLSAALLMLEVLQMKVFSFSLDGVTIYIAIAICQLGLGAAATILAMMREVQAEAVHRWGLACGVAAGVSIFVAHVLFSAASYGLVEGGWIAFLTLAVLAAPYVFLGFAIALVLVTRASSIGRAYAFNLSGSGAGCLLVFPMLDSLGAERAIGLIAAATIAGAALYAGNRTALSRTAIAAAALALLSLVGPLPAVLQFRPDPTGQLTRLAQKVEMEQAKKPGSRLELENLYTRWDQTARIDVYRLDSDQPEHESRMDGKPVPALSFMQDASAGSFLVGVGDDLSKARALFEDTVYGIGYARGGVEDVMIIGLGGAPDVQTALFYDAKHVDAVDINRTTIEIVRGPFRDFLGDPYGQSQVHTHQMDGRTFVRQTPRTYDLIQMSGVDTKAILASGTLAVNESYVYTREAIRDILERLRPNGMLAFIRAGDADAHRLTAIAVDGLRALGEPHPEKHVFVVAQGLFRGVLVSRKPFTEEDLARLHAWVGRREGAPPDIVMPSHEWIGLSFQHPMRIQYSPAPRPVATTKFFEALAGGQMDAFLATDRWDNRPPTDDRPFFFLRHWPRELLMSPPGRLALLYRFVAMLAVLSVCSILLPLLVLRWQGLRTPGAGSALLYFFCLGAGFMLVEIGLIQRFVLLLGHQSYAVTVVLFAILLGAGGGSLFSSSLSISSPRAIRRVIGTLVGVILVYGVTLPFLFGAAAGSSFGVRLALALVLLGFLGFLLGMPFPTALRSLASTGRPLVPWGIGVNGFASVFGATLAVPMAMIVGLRVVLLFGALLYVVALLTAPVRATSPGNA